MDKAVVRIIQAIGRSEKIMIFWDYDADGVTSSYVLYDFFKSFLQYDFISIQLPHRIEDGYGIKSYHLDQIKAKWVTLIITVDNGITAIKESLYAKQIGIDMIVTDHHQALTGEEWYQIPEAFAVVNPQVSSDYSFKWLCGVGVVFKLIMTIADRLWFDSDRKKHVLYRYMPIVAIGTVSDCVPLIGENRLFVKKGLELINSDHHYIPNSLRSFLDHFNLRKRAVTSTDIWFMIGPRLNAAGRMLSAYEALYALMFTGEKQKPYLEKLADLNTERRGIQEGMIKSGTEQLDLNEPLLILDSEEYHEGIIGIVAGRLTEKYHKPSMVLKIDREKWVWVASLRWPEYFSVIEMLYHVAPLLDRFGGHKQAGGLTVSLDKLDELKQSLIAYARSSITPDMLQKHTKVDTTISSHELTHDHFRQIDLLAPFGEWNREPSLLLQRAVIKHKQLIGKTNNHLKLYIQSDEKIIEVLQWSKADCIDNYTLNEQYDLVVSHRWDNERWYLVGE